ncbi:acyltransferase domain-containing protein [Microlunatus soli]|uniref:acyltransferase domain-containing protein n=1 Tax=Microlunatus soli TaxID=630515 RepID=UPI000B83B08F|nr:acyltransferase domain-containing protein [Microlunatus soli]
MPTPATSSARTTPTRTAADRLAAADDAALRRLGFRDDDRAELAAIIERVLADTDRLAQVEELAAALRARIGAFDSEEQPFAGYAGDERERADAEWGIGVLPLLALLVTADDVAAFHAERGIGRDISEVSLSDLGQQAWVHRRTYGEFGLHTFGWLTVAWSGALYWLGRLQFNLTRSELPGIDGGWVISTHIPEAGPLTPEAVAESFGRARAFFGRYFADYPTTLFHCASWLLDPQLVEVLAPESNMVAFQQLWELRGEPRDGDGDALFFVFRRRGEVDHTTLPQRTSLERAIVARLNDGGHWSVREGVIDQQRFPELDR